MKPGGFGRAVKGWFAACAATTVAIYALVLLLFVSGAKGPATIVAAGVNLLAGLMVFPVVLVVVCLLTAIPAALVVWISEISRTRSALFFGFAGGAVGVFGQTILLQSLSFPFAAFFAAAGFVAGLTYWHIAVKPLNGEPA
jgi:hypothetical protein